MSFRKTVVQLFNGKSGTRYAKKKDLTTNPTLAAAGFETREILSENWPINPFARMHNAYRGLDPVRALRVLVTERNADLICAHLESALLILLLRPFFFFRVPVLIWEVPWSPGWRYRDLTCRLAIPRADWCVVFGSSQLQLIKDNFGSGVKASVIMFCVDTDFYKPQPALAQPERYIWSCGVDPGRDFNLLLEATKDIDITIRIKAGSNAKSAISHPNAIWETRFLPQEEFRERYAGALMVVVCTKDTPNAAGITSLMEALSMGKPTIVSDNPALRDYLPPPDAAIVVPVGDCAALRKAILFLLENPQIATAMGERARIFAERNFGMARHYQAMAETFSAAIESRPRNG